MDAVDVLRRIPTANVGDVVLHYIDLTRGETEECYIVTKHANAALTEEEFAAAGLRAIAERMDCKPDDLAALEIIYWSSQFVRNMQLDPIRPGQVLCFPEASRWPIEVPTDVRPNHRLEPNIGGEEECFLCSSSVGSLLLYWQSTG